MIGTNNPLNIRYSRVNNWQGQTGRTKGFCNFSDVKYCIRAAFKILMSYRRRGVKSYREIIYAYAPPSENNTENYLRFVCQQLDENSFSVPNSLYQFACLIRVMAIFEGNPLNLSSMEVFNIIAKFGLEIPKDD